MNDRLKGILIGSGVGVPLVAGAAYLFSVSAPPQRSQADEFNRTNTNSVAKEVDLKIKGNKNSGIYHLPGCPNYDDIAAHNIVWFKTHEEAKAKGFRMARNC